MKASKRATREATQLFRACLVKGRLDEARVREVVDQLVTAKPRGVLGTLSAFRRLLKLETARSAAKIESALPLPPDQRDRLQQSLATAYGSGLSTSFTENPALIGGVRIQVGSDVYDGTVRGRLAALQRSF